jgi:hypothetical protein
VRLGQPTSATFFAVSRTPISVSRFFGPFGLLLEHLQCILDAGDRANHPDPGCLTLFEAGGVEEKNCGTGEAEPVLGVEPLPSTTDVAEEGT